MSTSSNPVNTLTNIDFDGLKQSLIDFLRAQPQFKDYNFTGSNLSVLLDIMALNSYNTQFFLNMAVSEMFLDTAQLRNSVLSHAKELNYLPRSSRSAVGYIDLEVIPNDSPVSITVQKGTSFSARIDNGVYKFVTDQAYTLFSMAGRYYANNVPIYEGSYLTEYFVVDAQAENQKFILSNEKIDTSSLSVVVFPNTSAATGNTFLYSSTVLGLSSSSEVFFLQAAENNKYELIFGDGIVGKAPAHSNLIKATYRVCSETAPNRATGFSPLDSIDGYSNISVATVAAATGGAEAEGIESIRFYAPRHYKTQERAVTSEDYETLLKERFPEIEAISVFGGEDMTPPDFGRVLISVDLSDADGIPEVKKTAITDYIRTRASLTIQPKVIDPVFLYINLTTDVKYNPSKTTLSSNDIKALVLAAITDYRDAHLNDFNISFLMSKLSTDIDNAETSILGNSSVLKVAHYLIPTLNENNSETIQFQNALQNDILDTTQLQLYDPAVTSSIFTYNARSCILEDDGGGLLQIVNLSGDSRSVITNIGTVNYETGEVVITNLNVSAYSGEAIKVYANLTSPEVAVRNNKILELSLDDVTVTVNGA